MGGWLERLERALLGSPANPEACAAVDVGELAARAEQTCRDADANPRDKGLQARKRSLCALFEAIKQRQELEAELGGDL